MPKFMLLLHDSPSQARRIAPGDMAKVLGEYRAWSEKLRAAGQYDDGNKLADDAGRIMRPGKDGGISVTDGPFAETKELLGGYYIVVAPDYDAAVEIARGSPHLKYGGRIEVRRVDFT